jgi:A/G-specific adenine glycosylase
MENIIKKIHKNLLLWYKKNARHELPWRQTDDMYHIYLSEVMLQQTQTSRVKEHFYPYFLEKYPRLEDLARASLDEVLASWSGLGYYSRARNLHKSVQLCAKNGLPHDFKELLKLPGVGKYTASAVCSFALHQDIAVVDTNIARVLKRYFALEHASDTQVWQKADEFLNHKNPTEHNLALMDLGSLICTPNPTCKECPLELTCKGKENPLEYAKTKKTVYESLELSLGVCLQEKKLALIKSEKKLYKGLLVLPSCEPDEEKFIGNFKHSYTKYRINVSLYKVEKVSEKALWYSYEELLQAPISSMTKKALEFIE